MSTTILGAGLAGLIAATQFQTADILEAQGPDLASHKALLRFRSRVVADAIGIPFRKVLVRKGIWHDGAYRSPSILLSNMYAQKVIGRLIDRSIWNLETVERFIAPENLHEQLVERAGTRIQWNTPLTSSDLFTLSDKKEPILSTLPMSLLAKWFPSTTPQPTFVSAPIAVRRWRIPNADVFQTVYFPSHSLQLYRASITKDLLIAEYMGEKTEYDELGYIRAPFGLEEEDCVPLDTTTHRMGKIAPIDDAWRKAFMFRLTHEHGIYSVGRYGTWRNLLLDDVVQDLNVIKQLIGTSPYAHRLASL